MKVMIANIIRPFATMAASVCMRRIHRKIAGYDCNCVSLTADAHHFMIQGAGVNALLVDLDQMEKQPVYFVAAQTAQPRQRRPIDRDKTLMVRRDAACAAPSDGEAEGSINRNWRALIGLVG